MLNVLRENVRRLAPLLWLVIAAFVVLMFWEAGGPGAVRPQDAATVDGEAIAFSDFESQYRNLENRFRSIYGDSYTPELAEQLGLPMQAIQGLVQQKVMAREARRMGMLAAPTEVQKAILAVPALQDANGNFIGEDEYRKLLQANRLDPARWEKGVREDVLINKFQRALSSAVWVSGSDAERSARADAEKAEIRYVSIRAEEDDREVEVDDSELAEFFAGRESDFEIAEQRTVGYFSLNNNVIRAALEITPEELRAYYDANQEEFTQEAQVRARHILLFVTPERDADATRAAVEDLKRQVEAGADFATLARENSEDEATASRGGDLGYFPRGRMTNEFETASFGAAAGDLVGPVQNQLGPRTGFHLIEVMDKREGGLQDFEQVENRIRVRQLNERARTVTEQRAREVAAAVGGRAYASAEELQALGEELEAPVEILDPFGVDDALPGIGRSTPFARTAFDMEVGQFSEPVRIAAGWAVLALLEVEPARVPELQEVEPSVREAAIANKRERLITEQLASLAAELQAGSTSLDDVAEELGATATESGEFDRKGSIAGLGVLPEVNLAALELEQGAFGGPVATERGLVLFEVTSRTHFDPVTFEETRQTTIEQLENERAAAFLQTLVEQRRNQLSVTYSRELIDNFGLTDPASGS